MKTIRFKYLQEISQTELDLQLYEDLTSTREEADLLQEDHLREYDHPKNGWHGEATPILISDLKRIVASIEATSATHVEIFNHCDHHGYYFYPVQIDVLDPKEEQAVQLKRIEEREREIDVRLAQLKEVQAACERLRSELDLERGQLSSIHPDKNHKPS